MDLSYYQLLMQPREGRQYRPNNEVFVRDWNTFKEVWGNKGFCRELGDPASEQCRNLIDTKLGQLMESEKIQCYLFGEKDLKPEYIEVFKQLVTSDKFKMYLEWDHEPLYLDNPRQFVVYKSRAPVASYLSKYRFSKEYEGLLAQMLEVWKRYLVLLVERNILISKDNSQEEISEVSKRMKWFEDAELNPKLDAWRKLAVRIIKDFKRQDKKEELMFLGVNEVLTREIKKLCQDNQLYFQNRYDKVSDYDEYRDLKVTKVDRNSPNHSFDDNSEESLEDENEDHLEDEPKKQQDLVIDIPRGVDNVVFKQFTQNGATIEVNLYSFGKRNPVDNIRIKLLSPNTTELQKNYVKRVPAIPGVKEYVVDLPCMYKGCHTFEVTVENSKGEPKQAQIFKIWFEADLTSVNEEGVYKLKKQNYKVYELGQNQNGLIPNWENSENIILTTDEQWKHFKFAGADFSISTHGVLCSREGQVAGWGKMYCEDDNTPATEEEEEADDGILPGLEKLNPETYRIEPPSLILDKASIRRVSCGEGYCLMSDCLGNVWAFGANSFGQLGLEHNDDNIDTSEPQIVQFFRASRIFVTKVFASCYGASFALDDKGQAYRWGTNQVDSSTKPVLDSYNNIVNFQYTDFLAVQSIPTPIGKNLINERIASIHPGLQFVLALTQNNKLYGWGDTRFLGIGTVEDAHFVKIDNLCNPIHLQDEVAEVSVGQQHCVVRKSDGSLLGWGESRFYRESKGEFVDRPEVIQAKFEGFFTCGDGFTVYEHPESSIKVAGNAEIFKRGKYTLPCVPVKVQASDGVIMVMGRPTDSQ